MQRLALRFASGVTFTPANQGAVHGGRLLAIAEAMAGAIYVRFSNHLPQGLITVFFVLNTGAVSTIAFTLLHYFAGQNELAYHLLRAEQDRRP